MLRYELQMVDVVAKVVDVIQIDVLSAHETARNLAHNVDLVIDWRREKDYLVVSLLAVSEYGAEPTSC